MAVENLSASYPDCIESFGLTLHVSKEFADQYFSAPQPGLAAHFYSRVAMNETVCLKPAEVRAANSSYGTDVLVLHFGTRNLDFSPRCMQVLAASSAAFYFSHSGYRIRSILFEAHGKAAASYMESGGFRLMENFAASNPAAFAGIPSSQHPYFFAIRREWAGHGAVNPLSYLFFTPSPHIYFAASEQRLLEQALLGASDDEIASALAIRRDSVKKTWRNIFKRVEERLPAVLPAGDRKSENQRGPEKRRRILDYVRTHMGELRPYSPTESNRH